MKRFLALAALFSVGLVASPVAAEEAHSPVERYVVPFDSVSPPHHDCITEAVHYQGSFEVKIITVRDGAGGATRTLHYRQRIFGTGLTTGNTYLLNAVYSETVRSSADGTPNVMTFPISYVEISKGGRSNYLATGIVHLTVSGTGDIVADVEQGSIRCVG